MAKHLKNEILKTEKLFMSPYGLQNVALFENHVMYIRKS